MTTTTIFWDPLPDSASTVSDLRSVEVASDALVWTAAAHGSPRGVWDPLTETTWFVYLRTAGALYINSYDHAAGELGTPALVAAWPFVTDDFHNVPTLAMDADGRFHIIWGGHNYGHWHYRSTNPRDTSAWTAQELDDGTYPYLLATDDGELIFTERSGTAHAGTFPAHEFGAMSRSTDGSTWTRTQIVDVTGATGDADFYQRDLLWAGGLVHMVWSVARPTHDDTWHDVHYATLDPATGNWSAVDGTALGSIITWAEHATCVAASVTAGHSIGMSLAWHQGRPVIAISPTESSGSGIDTDVSVVEWTGAAWETTVVTPGRGTSLLRSTPDDLALLVVDPDTGDVRQWRRVHDEWEDEGLLLRTAGFTQALMQPVRGNGPALAFIGQEIPATADDLTTTAPLLLITAPYQPLVTHTHDDLVVTADTIRDAGRWEVVVSGTPAAAVTTEDETDWLFTWTTV